MRAVVVRDIGGPDQLRVEEVPKPQPGPGEALVRVEASGVNFLDVYYRRGDHATQLPFTPGTEFVGTVEDVWNGPDGDVAPGDRVAAIARTGANAEYVRAPLDRLIHISRDTPVEHAMGLFQGMTAHVLTHDVHTVAPGETVLVHASAGGVGAMLVQYAKARGATVIGIVSTDEKAKIARDAGADHVIVAAGVDLAASVRKIAPHGVDVVFDSVGKSTFDASLHSVRRRGHVVLYGISSGAPRMLDPQELLTLGSITLTQASVYHYIEERSELLFRAQQVLEDLASGRIRVLSARAFNLDSIADAHRLLESRTTVGKLFIQIR